MSDAGTIGSDDDDDDIECVEEESVVMERIDTEDTIVESTSAALQSNMDDKLNRSIRVFNLNWKRGIQLTVELGVVHKVPGDREGNTRRLASFLYHVPGLNKEQVGRVLGDEKHESVLVNYFDLFDFSNLGPTIKGLEDGLRMVFQHFKPPGEAQQISRILECFGAKFNEDTNMARIRAAPQPEFDISATTVLAFSVIMLNSDLHNPNNMTRMTKQAYVRNLRGLNEGTDFLQSKLEEVYESIISNEIRHNNDRNDVLGNLFTCPDKAGFLYKKGAGRFSKWRPRWFILSEKSLYYFKNSEDVEPRGFIPLENILVRTCLDPKVTYKRRSAPAALNNGENDSTDSIADTASSISSKPSARKSLRNLIFRKLAFNEVEPPPPENKFQGKFWFQLYSWHPELKVKSARLKKNGGLVLGQHKTIKLKVDSRQEMETWVDLIRSKSQNCKNMQDLAINIRHQSLVASAKKKKTSRTFFKHVEKDAAESASGSLRKT